MTKLKGRGAEVHEDSLPRGEFDRQSAKRGGKQPRWQDGCEDSTGLESLTRRTSWTEAFLYSFLVTVQEYPILLVAHWSAIEHLQTL